MCEGMHLHRHVLTGKCTKHTLCTQVMKKKAKPVKGKPAGRMLTKTEPCASFFNFFSPPAVPEDPNEVDEDEMEELQHAMEEDYELGCALAPPAHLPCLQPLVYRNHKSHVASLCRLTTGNINVFLAL